MINVAAALIRKDDKFLICRRPNNKARGLLWEFVGGKTEPGETKEAALIRECKEELTIDIKTNGVFMHLVHEYPDTTVDLTVFNAEITGGEITLTEHSEYKWISPCEIPNHIFCPADREILKKIISDAGIVLSVPVQPTTVALGNTGITVPKNGFGP